MLRNLLNNFWLCTKSCSLVSWLLAELSLNLTDILLRNQQGRNMTSLVEVKSKRNVILK